jgi:hypothetical protein
MQRILILLAVVGVFACGASTVDAARQNTNIAPKKANLPFDVRVPVESKSVQLAGQRHPHYRPPIHHHHHPHRSYRPLGFPAHYYNYRPLGFPTHYYRYRPYPVW